MTATIIKSHPNRACFFVFTETEASFLINNGRSVASFAKPNCYLKLCVKKSAGIISRAVHAKDEYSPQAAPYISGTAALHFAPESSFGTRSLFHSARPSLSQPEYQTPTAPTRNCQAAYPGKILQTEIVRITLSIPFKSPREFTRNTIQVASTNRNISTRFTARGTFQFLISKICPMPCSSPHSRK